jgi:hypothetical protein
MFIAEARVETERPARYLAQLCEHVSKVFPGHSQMQARVEWSEDHGSIDFGWGRCILRTEPRVLTLRAEAPDEETLRRIERQIAERLERFGRRDRLAVTWTAPSGVAEGPAERAAAHRPEGKAHG